MKLSLAVQTPETPTRSPISLLSGSLEEMLGKASRWGADGLELMPVDPLQLDAAALRAKIKEYRLEVAAVGTALLSLVAGLTLLTPEVEKATLARERLYQTIDFAAAVGAPLITIGGFRGRFSALGAHGRQKFSELVCLAGDYAASLGVRLALEPINHYQSDGIANVKDGLAFLEEVNHPCVGLIIDSCHMVVDESSWTEPFRQAMDAGRLWHVHLAENTRLAPGQGLVDFRSILHVLDEIGYDRHLTLEILAKPDPDTAAQQGLAYILSLL